MSNEPKNARRVVENRSRPAGGRATHDDEDEDNGAIAPSIPARENKASKETKKLPKLQPCPGVDGYAVVQGGGDLKTAKGLQLAEAVARSSHRKDKEAKKNKAGLQMAPAGPNNGPDPLPTSYGGCIPTPDFTTASSEASLRSEERPGAIAVRPGRFEIPSYYVSQDAGSLERTQTNPDGPLEAILVNEEGSGIEHQLLLRVQEELRQERQRIQELHREKERQVVVEATVVGDGRPTKQTTSQMKTPGDGDSHKKRLLCGLLLIIFILAVTGAVVGIVMSRQDSQDQQGAEFQPNDMPTFQGTSTPTTPHFRHTDNPAFQGTFTPTTPPTSSPTKSFQELVLKIGGNVTHDLSVFDDPTTIQYETMDWLANVDEYNPQSDQEYIERYALALFYFSTNRPSWLEQYDFLSSRSHCEWRDEWQFGHDGISCDLDKSVTSLEIISRELEGTIPTELGLLTKLTYIDISQNILNGTLPTELGLVTQLTSLDLRHNNLTGTLPTELGGLTALENFIMFYNDLEGTIPTELGLWTKLSLLYLSENKLSGSIPSDLGLLPIVGLEMDGNNLNGTLPTEFGLMTKLVWLNLDSNQLSGTLPSDLGGLTGLGQMNLSYNSFTGSLPTEFAALANLEYFWVEGTALTGNQDAFCDSKLGLPLEEFSSDCKGETPEFECSCCTYCCEFSGKNCVYIWRH